MSPAGSGEPMASDNGTSPEKRLARPLKGKYRRLSSGSAAKRGPRRGIIKPTAVRENQLEPCYRSFGRWVRRRRLRADTTQQALADRLGVSREWVAGVEGGFQRVMLHQILALADLFDRKMRQ